MKIIGTETDETMLAEYGERLARARLERNLSQAQLATQAGLAKRTVERLEKGEPGTALWAFIRLCRALGFAERFDALLPDAAAPGPMEQLARRRGRRKRASGRRALRNTAYRQPDTPPMQLAEAPPPPPPPARKWKWGDEP